MQQKEQPFPTIYLTLVSIVIALGLEHLLNHVFALEPGGVERYLVLVQAVAMFLVLATIWLIYAVLMMAAPWSPRFQDFFAPLLLLVLLYFTIAAIGSSAHAWFYLVGIGSLAGAVVAHQNFHVASVDKSIDANATPILVCHIGLSILGFGSGIAVQVGLAASVGSTILGGIFGAGQLLGAWLVFRWWHAI